MKFKIENLGFIDKGEIELNDLTVICGENNVGKTYLNYSIYGFLEQLEKLSIFEIKDEDINEIYKNGFCKIDLTQFENQLKLVLEKASEKYTKKLSELFSTSDNFFKSTKIEIKFEEEELKQNYHTNKIKSNLSSPRQQNILNLFKQENDNVLEISLLSEEKQEFPIEILKDMINKTLSKIFFYKNPFVITSERTGIALFYKELDSNRSNFLFKELINEFFNYKENFSKYVTPIQDNINYIRESDFISKRKSFIVKDEKIEILKIWEQVLEGQFKITEHEIFFVPKQEIGRKEVIPMPLYISSSSSKSLLALDLYIKNIAQKNDVLIIDEPEMNLHPQKQIYMARLLAQLANNGIKVLITTHSDYIVKELNNLIMLSNDFERKKDLMIEYNYQKDEIIDKSKIKVYIASKEHLIKEVEITKYGIDTSIFDEIISKSNETSDAIYYSIDE